MNKPENLLLILSQEERDASEDYIRRRMKLLSSDKAVDLLEVGKSARSSLDLFRENRSRLDPSSATGKLMTRIYDSALAGYAQLINECNLTASTLQKAAKAASDANSAAKDDGEPTDTGATRLLGGLEIESTPEDEKNAQEIMAATLVDLDLLAIKTLRDACESLLKWWQSDHGQQESLHVNQYGDLQTATGRMAIRKARDDLHEETIVPFRGFFQEINLTYQRKNQEHTLEQRKARMRQEAGL
jgi:hypothetical protein